MSAYMYDLQVQLQPHILLRGRANNSVKMCIKCLLFPEKTAARFSTMIKFDDKLEIESVARRRSTAEHGCHFCAECRHTLNIKVTSAICLVSFRSGFAR